MSEQEVADSLKDAKIGDGPTEEQEDVVDPWHVESTSKKGVDYEKLIGMS